jgi:flagellar protein FliO/FliZ
LADVIAPIGPPAPPSIGLGEVSIKMALALFLILGVILLAYWMLRRFGPRFGLGAPVKTHGLRVESHLTLGPRKNIMVVRFLNKLLVLGVTDQSINLLTEVDASDETKDFQAVLDNAGRDAGDSGPSGPGPGG